MVARTFLPYSKVIEKPRKKPIPANPQTLGEHICKKRIEQGLFQKDIAKKFGITEDSITYWENGRSKPQVRYYPVIFSFIGYYPFTHETESIAGKLLQVRYTNGYTCKEMAQVLGVDTATATRWEQRKSAVHPRHHCTIAERWAQLPEWIRQTKPPHD